MGLRGGYKAVKAFAFGWLEVSTRVGRAFGLDIGRASCVEQLATRVLPVFCCSLGRQMGC